MKNYKGTNYNSVVFKNNCLIHREKCEYFHYPEWYEKNYKEVFFDYLVLMCEEGDLRAKVVLEGCKINSSPLPGESEQYFCELLKEWDLLIQENPPMRGSQPITKSWMLG